MSEIIKAPTVAEIMASEPLGQSAFDENKHRPFEFAWKRQGVGSDVEFTYEKRYLKPVIKERSTGKSKGPTSRAARLSAMVLPCPLCSTSHGVTAPCA